MVFLFYIIFTFVFYLIFILINLLMSSSEFVDSSISSFESGFDRGLLFQTSVRVHFFLIIILFVLFDLELVLFIGFLLLDFRRFVIFYLFFFFVILSFYLEFWLNKMVWFF
jgi:NADH:ubiquinone oxidoreductase subunit 3 (subunit A)